ncbi:carboxypeptidase regulatory-like domain-containing protein [Halalkalibaculum sp. DA3122]|uniref:carboxypeptidase regulatory-like domain-containing protein n=1 Tax=unclassified Halalkalibaculum TaxID=2964617 RepID=UPI003754DDF9
MFNFNKATFFTTILALIFSLSFSTSYAQENNSDTEKYKLTLNVVDAESGEALMNANIQILGIYSPHTTNQEGQLVFEEIENDPHTFKISADGYQTWKKTVTVTDDSKLTVELTPTG